MDNAITQCLIRYVSPAWVEERAVAPPEVGSGDGQAAAAATVEGEDGEKFVVADAPYDMRMLRGSMVDDDKVAAAAVTARARFAASRKQAVQVCVCVCVYVCVLTISDRLTK